MLPLSHVPAHRRRPATAAEQVHEFQSPRQISAPCATEADSIGSTIALRAATGLGGPAAPNPESSMGDHVIDTVDIAEDLAQAVDDQVEDGVRCRTLARPRSYTRRTASTPSLT